VSECDREASIMRRLWPTGGCRGIGKNLHQGHEISEISCPLISCAPQSLLFSVELILCCGIFTVIVACDFVLIKGSVELNSKSANLTWCVCVCVYIYIYIYIYGGAGVAQSV
jgi:hypothetical protein